MTYTQFAEDIDTANKVATKYPGIFVVEESSQPFFGAIVRDALNQLYEKPTGKQLIDAIVSAKPADDRGYKAVIKRVEISYKLVVHDGEPRGYKVTPSGGRSYARPAFERLGVNSSGGSDGKGASAIVGWCQNQISYTAKVGPNTGKPQYVMPPVTLGHELIHALHSLQGCSKSGQSIKIDGKETSEEEAQTVGLGPYAKEKITENALRGEFGLPPRLSYP